MKMFDFLVSRLGLIRPKGLCASMTFLMISSLILLYLAKLENYLSFDMSDANIEIIRHYLMKVPAKGLVGLQEGLLGPFKI